MSRRSSEGRAAAVRPSAPVAPTRGESGQATVELALALPVVVLLLLLVVQVGLIVRDAVLVVHAAREAARAAAVSADPAAATAAARAAGPLDAARLRVRIDERGAPGGRVRVHVDYEAATAVPLAGALVPDVALSSSASMRVER